MQNCDEFVWCPLFSITKEEKDRFLESLNKNTCGGNLSGFVFDALYKHGYDFTDGNVLKATKAAILKQLILKTDFAFDVLGEADYEKAYELLNEGQYENELLINLIGCFIYAWKTVKTPKDKPLFMDCSHVYHLLKQDIDKEVANINNKKVIEKFAPLINEIEKTVSGIDTECYLNCLGKDEYSLNEKLNVYLKEKYGYDFNEASRQTEYVYTDYFSGKVNEILQLSLLNDKEFWKDKKFSTVTFINEIYKISGEEKAKKALECVFNFVKNDEILCKFLENNLSIGFANKELLEKKLKELAIFTKISTDLFCPIFDIENESEKIEKGKAVFESFLYVYVYPHNKESVKTKLFDIVERKEYGIFRRINYDVTGYDLTGDEEKAVSLLFPEFSTMDNLFKRVYLKAYHLDKTEGKEKVNNYLYECFYNICGIINDELNIENSIQLDQDIRQRGFDLLKSSLKNYISVEKNHDYIASIVDIKTANAKEKMRFDVLEALGEAIFEFAVAEMIFYTLNTDKPNEKFDEFAYTSSKIKIVKKLEIEKAYISSTNAPCKFYYDFLSGKMDFTKMKHLENKEKYLEDTFEMILGAITLDKGHNEAIKVAKKLVCDTFLKDFSLSNTYSLDKSCCISTLNDLENSTEFYQIMHRSLYKLLGCLVLDLEDGFVRTFLSFGADNVALLFGDTRYFSEVKPPFQSYLDGGIDQVIELYGNEAKENFEIIKKKRSD